MRRALLYRTRDSGAMFKASCAAGFQQIRLSLDAVLASTLSFIAIMLHYKRPRVGLSSTLAPGCSGWHDI